MLHISITKIEIKHAAVHLPLFYRLSLATFSFMYISINCPENLCSFKDHVTFYLLSCNTATSQCCTNINNIRINVDSVHSGTITFSEYILSLNIYHYIVILQHHNQCNMGVKR